MSGRKQADTRTMPVLEVGSTKIPYTVRRSSRAKRLRVVVRPGGVEVVAPQRNWRLTITSFVHAHRRWILAKQRELEAREAAGQFSTEPQRYVSGAGILFRGRRLALRVEPADLSSPEIRYRSAFHVRVPRSLLEPAREETVRQALGSWFAERARSDAQIWIREYSPLVGRSPAALRIGNQKTLWGSCSPRGTISLNRRLVAAPKRVFEYVVVHELCHLVERNHGPEFWRLVASLLPDYRERRSWLKRHGIALG